MPEYFIKNGVYPDELMDYLQDNEDKVLKVSVEVARDRKRLRGAFHALLADWYNSGCFSAMWFGHPIRTIGGLKTYYKYWACGAEDKAIVWRFGIEESEDPNFFFDKLPERFHSMVVPDVRGWENMTMKQQCKAIHIMLSEIKMAEEIPKSVEYSMKVLEGDRSALMSVGYYNYINKHRGEHFEAGGFNLL